MGEGPPSRFRGVSASDTTTRFFILSVPSAGFVVRLPPPDSARSASFLTALYRTGRLHQQGTMFHSGASGSAAGYFLHHPLKFLIKTVLVSVIYMIYMMLLSTLNKRTIDVTNIMIMLFF
jgi:hypothetical protein